jgi:hypothetical protein
MEQVKTKQADRDRERRRAEARAVQRQCDLEDQTAQAEAALRQARLAQFRVQQEQNERYVRDLRHPWKQTYRRFLSSSLRSVPASRRWILSMWRSQMRAAARTP